METVNNANFTAARDAFAGRREWPEGMACSRCTNGVLMSYSRGLNRWIVITAVVKAVHYVMGAVSRLLGRRYEIAKPGLKIKWPD